MRSLDIPRAAEASLRTVPPQTRALLDAYLRGVNAWIAAPTRPLPPEFRVLRFRPEPWTARQSVELSRIMAWDLQSGSNELRLARALARVGPERIHDLFPPNDSGAVVIQPGTGSWRQGPWRNPPCACTPRRLPSSALAAREIPRVPARADEILDWAAMSRASNSWVIGGARTASGKPILANDPHLELRAPSLWYLAVITSPGFQVAGATIPGMPIVILGHNRRIAWGWTNVGVDDVDYVIERFTGDTARVADDGRLEGRRGGARFHQGPRTAGGAVHHAAHRARPDHRRFADGVRPDTAKCGCSRCAGMPTTRATS